MLILNIVHAAARCGVVVVVYIWLHLRRPRSTHSGFEPGDMETVASMLHEAIELAITIKARSLETNPKAKLVDFISAMKDPVAVQEMEALKAKVCSFCSTFSTVGFERDEMVYGLE